ncbi:CRISPR-associated endonuclease Cas6 [Lewinella cohaerens]|uniref:CRISPR-associated endonuclease Cas6 n=1 Tax=Lewinella cohaerens TaxID=70995 RepID=UPI000360807A|nr:CRISPR-associated endonuclease Cas6 [Lewinella cohaerens]
MNIQLLTTTFDLPLTLAEISRWRGAWCEMAGWEVDRFHNHRSGDGKVIYRYPLLQYRTYRRQAGFVAIQEAVKDVQQTLAVNEWQIRWKNTLTSLGIRNFQLDNYELHLDQKWHSYRIHNYLPFNKDNFEQWQNLDLLQDKIALLARIIPGHLISFAKSVHWRIPGRFDIEITNLTSQRPIALHQILRPAFDLEFRTQLILPSNIGLGKGVSHGFGVLEKLISPRIG